MGLDFISPLVNGIAKYMLKKGLKSMMDPFTGNLAVRRGKRVFEITRERYPSPSVNLLFLIYNGGYAVWTIEVESGVVTLTPYDFKILDYISLFAPTTLYPSTAKTNEDYSKCVISIEPDELVLSDITDPQYGHVSNMLVGVRNCFINNIFDTDVAYLTYGSAYICSSRHSSYVDPDIGLIKDLELWEDGGGGKVQYLNSDNEVVYGSSFSFSSKYDVFAVLSPTKIVGVDKGSTSPVSINDSTWERIYVMIQESYWNGHEWVDYLVEKTICILLGHAESGTTASYHFYGWSLEDIKIGTYTKTQWSSPSWRVVPNIYFVGGCIQMDYEAYTQTSGDLKMMDYDNNPETEDFICFYRLDGVYTSRQNTLNNSAYHSGYGAPPDCQGAYSSGTGVWEGYKYTTNTGNKYKLAYCINGSLTKSVICEYNEAASKTTWTGSGCTLGSSSITYNIKEGQRIVKPSCFIHEDYMLYTYVIEDYGTPWTFNKRVMGIIDIATGTHNTYEVNDELLSDMYSGFYDKEEPSAIGFHRKTG